jgi:catechol 2,3-dioxygenase-like lactoylglutathione lyase family enzyme
MDKINGKRSENMTYKVLGFDHVQLAAPKGCEKDARAFFSDVLGFKEIEKPASLGNRGGCWFQCGTQEIHVGVEEPFVPAKKAHPAIVVENLEALRDHLNASTIAVKEDKPINGRNRFFVNDPFGNRIEFLEYL